MTERENNIENLLGLTEYPSSSDEENNVPRPSATQGWHQQQSQVAQTSRDADEVINLDESPSPNASSPNDQVESTPTTSTVDQRREQSRLDHNLFWSAIGNPQRLNTWIRYNGQTGSYTRAMPPGYGLSHEAASGGSGAQHGRPALFGPRGSAPNLRPSVSEPRSVVHEPVPELSQPQLPPSASADILSIMAFRRLQRYRTYRRNRASSLGLVCRLPPLDLSRETSPRATSRVHRHPPHTATIDRIVSSMLNFESGGEGAVGARSRPAAPPVPERQQEEEADQNEAGDNDNEQSGDETESVRLSPRLPAPEGEQPENNSDNMEVDEPRAASAQEEEAGDGEDESEADSALIASPAPSNGNVNNMPNEPGNASGRIFIDIRRRSRGHKRRRESERQRTEAFNVKEFNQNSCCGRRAQSSGPGHFLEPEYFKPNNAKMDENLLRLLECPVCLEWMEPPMLQCRLGHLVCARCRARLSTCPVCRSGFSSVRNRAMEGVAELLRYPCRHGCGREARLRRRGAHEASCPRRRYRCPAHACMERAPLPYEELVRHVQRNHAAMIKTGRLHKFSVKVNAQQHDNWLIMAGFGLFHLRIAVDIRTWSILAYVAYIGPKCRAKEFTYEVTVIGQHNGRKLVYTRATHSDLESSSLNVSRQDCFHITLDEAINFLRFRNRHCQPDRLLDFTVEITKQDVIIADNNSVISDE